MPVLPAGPAPLEGGTGGSSFLTPTLNAESGKTTLNGKC